MVLVVGIVVLGWGVVDVGYKYPSLGSGLCSVLMLGASNQKYIPILGKMTTTRLLIKL